MIENSLVEITFTGSERVLDLTKQEYDFLVLEHPWRIVYEPDENESMEEVLETVKEINEFIDRKESEICL